MNNTVFVTGGAGFIGSALVRQLVQETRFDVVNVDKLTYAGSLTSLVEVAKNPRHHFVHADIRDEALLHGLFQQYRPRAVLHLAAESHVDRSIDGPRAFVETNVLGTYCLLQESLRHWRSLNDEDRRNFRFVHVSTDEVYGSLGPSGLFTETTPYDPSSPYSASKAASDHLARAWWRTYGLPVVVTNCSNNFGPYQFPEKLIPLVVSKAIAGEPLPIYGTGQNVRDWLFVDDHARALRLVCESGLPGQTYNVGGSSERTNLQVVRALCALLDEMRPDPTGPHERLITHVADRPGHDQRYAIDSSKISRELGWQPRQTFESGLRITVDWYLRNQEWLSSIVSGAYRGERLGAGTHS